MTLQVEPECQEQLAELQQATAILMGMPNCLVLFHTEGGVIVLDRICSRSHVPF
jgi:hypothetical protein